MLRAALGECYALLGGQASPKPWHTAQNAGRSLWRRSYSASSKSMIRTSLSKRLTSLPARPNVTQSLPKSRNSTLRSFRRDFHNTSRQRDIKNSGSEPFTKGADAKEPQGLSARLKKLSREYGWSAVGVYLGLSVLDFPFCFLFVRVVGAEKIGEFEHFVVSNVKKAIPQNMQDKWHEYWEALKGIEKEELGNDEISEHVEMAGWGVEEAQARHTAEASLGTQLALAYAIHKSFIFVRVPLTAAVTPKVVKVLRSWGWNIGKRRSKTPKVNKA
ncbi:hypothetical protein BJ170DRAFT_201832 [Xylariales sp. AK1849]|nr:hypothetical protein BJ170DRAFT_201832 [Xylariales sp. AK1849]